MLLLLLDSIFVRTRKVADVLFQKATTLQKTVALNVCYFYSTSCASDLLSTTVHSRGSWTGATPFPHLELASEKGRDWNEHLIDYLLQQFLGFTCHSLTEPFYFRRGWLRVARARQAAPATSTYHVHLGVRSILHESPSSTNDTSSGKR